MDPKEEKEIEQKIKRENKANLGAEELYAGIANGIPNEEDRGGDHDALNANLAGGQMTGSHMTNVNSQTDMELGGIADPGGIDPAMDREFLENIKKNMKKNQ
ncbi:MAG TPA: hypothetical protein VHY08_22225 [Bacillota bacterium]|nr:hypothetical protein [Bacillota bacterium]